METAAKGSVLASITSPKQIQNAYEEALKYSSKKKILIEEFLPGATYRILIANGQFIFCIKKIPNGVIGDGTRSIEELIMQENLKNRTERFQLQTSPNLILDTIASSCLTSQGLKPQAIPDINQYVYLRPFTSRKWGAITEDCSSSIHKENIQLAISVSQKTGLSVCGVDLISEDISIPWHENRGKINEINFQPMIGTHSTSLGARHTFFKAILNNNGQIPIHVYLGSPQA